MGFFNQLLQSILPNSESSEKGQKEVLVKEQIKRNQIFLNEYQSWIAEEMHHGLLAYLQENYSTRKNDKNANVNFYTLDKTNAKGFYFRAEIPWNTKDYQFLIHYFTLKLIDLEYLINNSSKEAIEDNGVLTIEEFFYLKPRLKFKRQLPFIQLFGNIIVEHKVKNEQTDLVKVIVNTYTDRSFKKAYDFEDFMALIFSRG